MVVAFSFPLEKDSPVFSKLKKIVKDVTTFLSLIFGALIMANAEMVWAISSVGKVPCGKRTTSIHPLSTDLFAIEFSVLLSSSFIERYPKHDL